MVNILLQDQVRLIAFWLCFTRWVCIVFQLPLFDQFGIPSIVKILTSFVVAFAFFHHLEPALMADFKIVGADHFWFLTIYQALVGLTIGFLVKVIMSLYLSAGTMISQQMGYTAVQYFNPHYQQSMGPIEELLRWVMLVLILSSGALFPMFSGVFQSFTTISLANMSKLAAAPIYFTNLFISLFESAILLASPILFTNIFITCIMGITARIVPQMNVLMISFVVNIGVGLFILITISNELFGVAYQNYVKYLGQWFQYLK